jgi:mannose-6-phosphate isomerase
MEDSLILLKPVYMERVWGGRTLESLYGRSLPSPGKPFGESWEVVDREEAQSVVASGSFAGKSLHELWANHRAEVFGAAGVASSADRFPVLVKILDARDKLSIQVHPPADIAPSLNGEPKTEMWYIVHAEAGAELYVGLVDGINRERFEEGLEDGATAEQVHRITPKAGEFIFIPSGRLHAIGAGLLIFEIQQNSDTTYRVFDWNRVGLDGKPRDLHVEESLLCIDFDDVEPGMTEPDGDRLVACDYFEVSRKAISRETAETITTAGEFAIIAVTSGPVSVGDQTFQNGDFFLIPASAPEALRHFRSSGGGEVLVTRLP